MSYKSLIDANLNRAFNLAKDLAVDVTFTKKSGSDFDFGTASTTEISSTDITIKGLWIDADKKSSKIAVPEKHLMIKRKEVGDVTSFDSLIENGITYNISSILKDYGYIVILSAFKEA